MQLKKGGSNYTIPFEIPFLYVHPQVDSVAPERLVEPTDTADCVEGVEEAITFYLAAFQAQFAGEHSASRKSYALRRFTAYLQSQNHSLRLDDLTFEDGRAFIQSLSQAYMGTTMSEQTRRRYRSALRSLSRFLVKSNVIDEDVFFALKAH